MADNPSPTAPNVRRHRRALTLVIAVDSEHAYVAYIGRSGDRAAQVRDSLRETHAASGVRFHCAMVDTGRWKRLEKELLPKRAEEDGDG